MSSRSIALLVISLGVVVVGCGESKSSKNGPSVSVNQPQTNNTSSSSNNSNVTQSSDSSKTNQATKDQGSNANSNSNQVTLTPGNQTSPGQGNVPTVGKAPQESKGLSIGFQGLTVTQLIERRQTEGQSGPTSNAANDANNGLGDSSSTNSNSSEASNDSQTPTPTLPNQISLPVRLQTGLPAAAADMVVSFDASLLKFVRARAGKGATDAGKSVLANPTGNGTAKLVIMGLNQNIMRSGDPVAWIDFEVLNPSSTAVPAIRLSNVTIADPTGQRVSAN